MQRYFSPPPTYYPCSIPSSHHTGSLRGHPGFGLDAGGNTPILHKDSNPRQRDGQQRIEKTDKQKGRVRGEGERKKKDMRRGLRRPPLPHLHPHQHAGGMTGIKRGVKTERRTEDRGGKMKGRESALTKQTPAPLVIGILSP